MEPPLPSEGLFLPCIFFSRPRLCKSTLHALSLTGHAPGTVIPGKLRQPPEALVSALVCRLVVIQILAIFQSLSISYQSPQPHHRFSRHRGLIDRGTPPSNDS